MEKNKKEKSPWVKSKKKRGPKKKKKVFDEGWRKTLTETDKGSWFDQSSLLEDDSVHDQQSSAVEGASQLKLEGFSKASVDESSESSSENEETFDDSVWTVVDRQSLNRQIERNALCRFGGGETVSIQEVEKIGLGAVWNFNCKNSECASHAIDSSFHTTPKGNRFYDLNRGLVLGLRMIGRGYSSAQKLLSILNLPSPVGKAPWAAHTKAIEDTARNILDQELDNAALEVKRLKLANGDITAVDDNASDDQLREVVAEAGVSIDGSWSSRGWSARDGVVAVISIDTGKILDVVHLSNQCTACSQKERQREDGTLSRMDFLRWYIEHEPSCYLNHDGSAQSMEAEGACRLYGRSLSKHKLKYIPFVGDGDSKSYKAVTDMAPYGAGEFIPKEDCIGHVTKRMGTALRKLLTTYKGKTLDDGRGIGGKGRLTTVRIDALQNVYGKAIRENKGDAKAMSRATHAILKHYSSTPEKPRHEDCPRGKDSWCSYNRDEATGENTHQPIKDALPEAIVKVVQPVFDRLGDEQFLVGCEKCLDQNRNESWHHVVWSMAPKEQFNSQQEVSVAVSLSVLVFNNGIEKTMNEFLPAMNMTVNDRMQSEWQKIDGERVRSSDYKSNQIVKKRRKKLRREKSKKQDGFVHQEGVMYSSGSFYTATS